jgi:putative membrane fusion protein
VSALVKWKKRGMLIFIIAVVTLGIIIEVVPEVTGALTKTEILEYGNLQITETVTCYFIRKETVYMAPSSGTINYYVEDGVKVRKNSKILDIVPKTSKLDESKYADIITRLNGKDVTLNQMTSNEKGIVSYYVDGYEGYFTPETMTLLDYQQVQQLKTEPVNLTRDTTLLSEPLFKICEGNYWYMVCWVNAGDISKFEVGNTVKVNLPLGQIKATVENLIDKGEQWLVVLKTTRFYEDFERLRSTNATIITQDYTGILIRNSSITTKDGIPGVYIKSKNGDFVFKPVKIITSDGDSSLVSVSTFYNAEGNKVDTVEIYDEILKNPTKKH